MRRLIIHTGDHKTGTTSIQYALAANHVRARAGSISYPLARLQLNHNFLQTPLEAFGRGDEPPQFETLRRMLDRDAADTSIISAETLEHVAPALLSRALRDRIWPDMPPASIRVLTYVRPHAARILSSSVEQVKVGWMRAGPVKFFEKSGDRFYYAPRLRQMREAFGTAFTLRPSVRRALHRGTALHDFCRIVFGENGYEVDQDRTENPSLCMEDLMRIAALQRELPDLTRWERHAVGWHHAELFAARRRAQGDPGTPPQIAAGLATRIRDTYLADATQIDAEFFDGRPVLGSELERAIERAAPERQSFDPDDWLSADEISEMRHLAAEVRAMAAEGQLRARLRFERLVAVRGADVAEAVAGDYMRSRS